MTSDRFGEVMRHLALTRLRQRGLSEARDEFLPAATVPNLKRLAKLAPIPPPSPIPVSSTQKPEADSPRTQSRPQQRPAAEPKMSAPSKSGHKWLA